MEHAFRDVFERYLEDVHVGDRFRHWPGRTISQAAADQFCYWTSNPQPLHLDAEYAAASQHGRVLVNGILVFAIAVGLSVPNLSGNTIANLGFERVDHHAPRSLATRSTPTPRFSRCALQPAAPTAAS